MRPACSPSTAFGFESLTCLAARLCCHLQRIELHHVEHSAPQESNEEDSDEKHLAELRRRCRVIQFLERNHQTLQVISGDGVRGRMSPAAADALSKCTALTKYSSAWLEPDTTCGASAFFEQVMRPDRLPSLSRLAVTSVHPDDENDPNADEDDDTGPEQKISHLRKRARTSAGPGWVVCVCVVCMCGFCFFFFWVGSHQQVTH